MPTTPTRPTLLRLLALSVLWLAGISAGWGQGANPNLFRHDRMTPVEVGSMRVWLGEPIQVTAQLGWQTVWQHSTYEPSWSFIHLTPVLGRFPGGHLIATYALDPDNQGAPVCLSAFQISKDGGEHWGRRYSVIMQHNPMIFIPKPDDSLLAIPSELMEDPVGNPRNFSGPAYFFKHGGEEMDLQLDAVRLVDWPFPLAVHPNSQPKENWHAGLAITGSWLKRGKTLLVPAEIRKRGSANKESEVLLASEDGGYTWRYRSTIADPDPARAGEFGYEGPNEGFILPLADGDIMAVYRVGGGVSHEGGTHLNREYSRDDGRTWSKPDELPASSVKPELVRTASGAIALATGRPGIYLWISTDPRGKTWQKIDIVAHHNQWAQAVWPNDPSYAIGTLTLTSPPFAPRMAGRKFLETTSYTGLTEVAPDKLILLYDRDTERAPTGPTDLSRVFVLPIELERRPDQGQAAGQARAALHRIVDSQQGFARVHAAEVLVMYGESDSIRKMYLGELARDETSNFRVGVWRTLARAASTPQERAVWEGKLEKVFLDPNAPDRPQATEALCKLGHHLNGRALQMAREAAGPTGNEGIMSAWALAVAGQADGWRLLTQMLDSPVDRTRMLAGFCFGWLRPKQPEVLAALAQAADREKPGSAAYPYLLSATLVSEANPARMSAWQAEFYRALPTLSPEAIYDSFHTLLPQRNPSDIASIAPLLQSPDSDTRVAAAWTILDILSRAPNPEHAEDYTLQSKDILSYR